ncbi:pentapeptide repeat-containing protein [Streptomyces cacaoi]|uniref:pentapeptide repeat-containing protein n=1 Tax=Streptomyces cacaoi TaxID=1898 RepID=UPI0033203B10
MSSGTARAGARTARLRRQAARRAPLGPRLPGQRRGAPRRPPAPTVLVPPGDAGTGPPPGAGDPAPGPGGAAPEPRPARWPRVIEVLAVVVASIAALATVVVTREQTVNEVRVTREGQITDRYTSAVDNLGDKAAEVRLGGIYALQRIMKDSPRDQSSVVDVLSAYVRTHARGQTAQDAGSGRPAADVQAAFEVLARRDPHRDGRSTVDLREAHLANVSVRGTGRAGSSADGGVRPGTDTARLPGANLSGAVLESANLAGARMNGDYLVGTRLTEADLPRADLRSSWLVGARLDDARLNGADLHGARAIDASLRNADLRGADLRNTDLRGVDLTGADLTGADLRGAYLRTQRVRTAHGKRLPYTSRRSVAVTAHQLRKAKLDDHTVLPPEVADDPTLHRRQHR